MYRQSLTRNRKQQNDHLDHLNNQVIYTGQGQNNIAHQLQEQKRLREDFHREIDYTTARMNGLQKKMAQLLETSGKMCSLLIMVGFTVCLVLMIIIL